ncbi:hypothetical protein [Phaffia rhodozyma]|uniref:Uncharacterized protein n=1 Tax=Phaffia rhodozyma TaxID=264483 RepID=A0A0F7SGF8_PHARH|nr:hypothetical protein [Phaffia rhodozyma]
MYIHPRQSDGLFSSSTSSATIGLVVCLVLIGVSAVIGVSLLYYRCRRKDRAQVPVSIDSSMPTMKITFLSPPSSTSSPIRMELVPASTGHSHETDCQAAHSSHSRIGLVEAGGGGGGACCGVSAEDHRTRSILSDDVSLEEGVGDWSQVQSYEILSPTLSPDNHRFSSFEFNSQKGMDVPSALGLETRPNLSRTMSLSSDSFYAHYPSRQLEDSAHQVHRHTVQPGFSRSVSFGAYGEPTARPRPTPNHSYSYSHQSYGTPSFYRFTSAPPQTSPVSSEDSPSDFLPASPSISYHRPTISKHRRSISMPDALPFTPSSSPPMTTASHFAWSSSSPIFPLPPSLHCANSNTIPALMRQTKAMEFESASSRVFTDGYFSDLYERPIEHLSGNSLLGESLIKSTRSSVATTHLDQEAEPVWDHGRAGFSRNFSQEREEDRRYHEGEERLPPGYEQSEESFNGSTMV